MTTERTFRRGLGAHNLRTLVLLIGALAAALLLRDWIIQGSFRDAALQFTGLVVGTIALASLGSWRKGLYLFMVWLVFEDLPRKYLGNNMIIYFGKDVLVGVVYVALLFARDRRRERTFHPPFGLPLLLFVWLALIQVFNPNSTSLFYGLLGMKLYFYYVPLMFVGYALARSEADLRRFLVFNLGLGVIVALLGITQAIVGLDFLNPQVLAPELQVLGHLTRESPISHQVVSAPSSVFVSAGRFDFYLVFIFILTLSFAGYQLLGSRKEGKVSLLALGVIVVAALLSGSRSAPVYSLASGLVWGVAQLWGAPYKWRGRERLLKAIWRGFLAVALCIIVMVFAFPQAMRASWSFVYETIDPSSPASELSFRARDYPLANLMVVFDYPHWPIGYGTGTSSLGTQYVASVLGGPPSPVGLFENGCGTLILEMGVLAPFLWVLWTGALVVSAWRVVRGLVGTKFFPVGVGILWWAFLLLLPFTWGGIAPYQNYILNAYLWLLVGILFRLPSLAAADRVQGIAHANAPSAPLRQMEV